jgi:ribose-phosphate pyrophosphokinase
MRHGELRLFAPEASRDFAQRVAAQLGVRLAPHEERVFEDGEHKLRPQVSVRGKDVYVIHALYADASASADDKLCRLLFFLGALRDAGAARITAVLPYLAYARKDQRSKPRDPVTTRYVGALFEAVGVDRVVAFDVHNVAAYENAFRCAAEHLDARRLIAGHFAPRLREREVAVLSPDEGGVKRADAVRRALETALGRTVGGGYVEKFRSDSAVRGGRPIGDVAGRSVLIVDDLIATGTTLAMAARAARDGGAREVLAVASHGLFFGDAGRVLDDPAIDRIVVSDSVPPFRLAPALVERRLEVLDTAALFAGAIRRLHGDGSLAELLGDEWPAAEREAYRHAWERPAFTA